MVGAMVIARTGIESREELLSQVFVVQAGAFSLPVFRVSGNSTSRSTGACNVESVIFPA